MLFQTMRLFLLIQLSSKDNALGLLSSKMTNTTAAQEAASIALSTAQERYGRLFQPGVPWHAWACWFCSPLLLSIESYGGGQTMLLQAWMG